GSIAISGSNLFAVNGDPTNTIGEYTTSGATVNAALISGLPGKTHQIVVSGPDLFVANGSADTVGDYTTAAATENAALISGLNGPFGLAVDGSNLFVTNAFGGTISEYTTSGALVNAALISGLNGPSGIAIIPTTVPEASTLTFMTLAFAGLGFCRR